MFLKLILLLGYSIFLFLLLMLCITLSIWFNWTTINAFALWLALIFLTILMSMGGLYLLRIYRDGHIASLFPRRRLTKIEWVFRQQWKQGFTVIHRTFRRNNPLPWFVVTGKQCGKSTVIAGAGLPLVILRTENETIVPTRILRWHFFKTIAFLDLSSHFLLRKPAFERAWRHLARWSRRRPPAGIIVCVSASDLLHNDAVQLHVDARQIRSHLEVLRSSLKRPLPVYVLITCCDEIPGFSAWAKQLSPAQRQQALGYYWEQPPVLDSREPANLNGLFRALRQGTELTRMAMASELGKSKDALFLLDIPDNICQLQTALNQYISAILESDICFDSGMLGGVWLTVSEQQNQRHLSHRSVFTHELVNIHLPTLSRYHRRILTGIHNKRYRPGHHILMLLCFIVLGFSALMSARILAWQPELLTRDELVNQLRRNESWHEQPWFYLPFVPLLNLQHQWLEKRLLQHTPHALQPLTEQLSVYEQKVISAEPDEQFRLIIQLAQTILSEQKLRQGMLLTDARQLPTIPETLRIISQGENGSGETTVAFERAWLSFSDGADTRLSAQRRLLEKLTESYPQWLFSTDSELQAIKADDFGFKSTGSLKLEGIWTRQGQDEIYARARTVIQALGKTGWPPSMEAQLERIPELRQSHWIQWVLALQKEGFQTDNFRSQQMLVRMSDGNSPAMRLAKAINEDLSSIDDTQTRPWLRSLRTLQALSQQATRNRYLRSLEVLDNTVRQKIASRIKVSSLPAPLINEDISDSWLALHNSEQNAISAALNAPENSLLLINGLFTPRNSPGDNPVRQMYFRLEELRRHISPERHDFAVNTLWALYQNNADFLLNDAFDRAACEVQYRWQKQVLWPLTKSNKESVLEDKSDLASESVQAFMRDTGTTLLDLSQGDVRPVQFRGHAFPLTQAFLFFVNHVPGVNDALVRPRDTESKIQDELTQINEQQEALMVRKDELESHSVSITLKTQPATIPGKARVMPTGTRITLTCDEQSSTLASMNFSEQKRFYWRPANCTQVELTINFPEFDLNYSYSGDSAWPEFLRDFSEGQHTFSASDFGEQEPLLRAMGINHILVRYQLSDLTPVQQVWRAWQETNEKLSQINEQRAVLQKMLGQWRQPRLSGHLSSIPKMITVCKNEITAKGN